MKKTVYLDTTIPSYLFDERQSIRLDCERTKKWWETESQNFEVFISPETVAELEQGEYPHKLEVLEFVKNLTELERQKTIYEIAEVYVANRLVPQTVSGDALHLAYASFYAIDFLLTWNCNHLANANKKQHIRIVNAKLDLRTPEIITPLELFTEEE